LEETIKQILEIVNRASKFLAEQQLKDLQNDLIHGAWKKMYEGIEADFKLLQDEVNGRSV
tara:strand:- start:1256 stop:1435 length:180 start_codon:yes stop_codon:yes gene_type:complete